MEARNAWKLTDQLDAPSGKGDPFAAAVRATRMPMVITDPREPDNPIVFVNEAFLELTGYARDEVIGRNCRFLQGPDTEPSTVRRIAEAVDLRTDISVDILNYRKDGSTFWNALYMSPVSDEAGNLLFFFASQLDITSRKNAELEANRGRDAIERAVAARTRQLEEALEARTELLHEVEHRVKNNLQLVSALVFLEGRQTGDAALKRSFAVLKDRVDALAAVHRRLYREDDLVRFDLAQFIRDYATEVVTARGEGNVNLKLTLHELQVLASHAAPVALIASELIRQAVEQAQGPAGPQDLELTVSPVEHQICRLCVTSGDQDSFVDGIEPRLRTHKQDSQSRSGVIRAPQLQERGVERVLVE